MNADYLSDTDSFRHRSNYYIILLYCKTKIVYCFNSTKWPVIRLVNKPIRLNGYVLDVYYCSHKYKHPHILYFLRCNLLLSLCSFNKT